MRKKLLSITLALLMCLSLMAVNVAAENDGIAVLADYTQQGWIDRAGLVADTENKLFGEKSATFGENGAAVATAMNAVGLATYSLPTDWSGYTHVNMWVYSDAASDREFRFAIRNATANGSTPSRTYLINQDFAGWKKISIPISDFSANANFDMTAVKDYYVSLTWGISYDEAKYVKLSFAKIWLSTETETNDTYSVIDGSNYSNIVDNVDAVSDSSVKREYASSVKLAGTGQDSNETKRYAFSSAQDWTDYSYINFWVKNTNSANSKAVIRLCIEKTEASGAYGQWYSNLNVSDDDWAIVSIPLSSFSQGKSGDYTDEKYKTMCHITGFFLDAINGNMYLDKVWVSKELPAAESKELYDSDTTVLNSATVGTQNSEIKENNTYSLYVKGADFGSNSSSVQIQEAARSAQDWTPYNRVNFRVKNVSDSQNATFAFMAIITGTSASGSSGYYQKKVTITPNSGWQTVSYALSDFTNSCNSTLQASGGKYTVMSNIESIRLGSIIGEFYIEKIWLSRDTAPESTITNNATDVTAYTRKIDLTYPEKVDAATASGISVMNTTSNMAVTDFVTDVDGNIVSILLPEGLDCASGYTVTSAGVYSENGVAMPKTLSFTTDDFSVVKGEKYISARMCSDSSDNELIIAAYANGGALNRVKLSSAVASDGRKTLKNENVPFSANETVRVFLWNSLTELVPQGADISVE